MKEKQMNKVLMYHSVVSPDCSVPENREVGAELYDVTIDSFKHQMKLCAEKGLNGVLLNGEIKSLKENEIILTFDDGEMNNFDAAFPILKEYGFKAYFFIIAKRIGKSGYMGWDQIKELHREGMVIGSHGLSHEILTNLMDTQIEEELAASKKHLEINLEIEVDSLSIPRGFCNDNIIKKAYKAGYKNVFISDRPNHLKLSCISRTAVKGGWTLDRFEMALNGKTPLKEKVKTNCVRTAKFIFRESGYNFIRSSIIKMTR